MVLKCYTAWYSKMKAERLAADLLSQEEKKRQTVEVHRCIGACRHTATCRACIACEQRSEVETFELRLWGSEESVSLF